MTDTLAPAEEYLRELMSHVPQQARQTQAAHMPLPAPLQRQMPIEPAGRGMPGPMIGAYLVSGISGALTIALIAVLYARRDK